VLVNRLGLETRSSVFLVWILYCVLCCGPATAGSSEETTDANQPSVDMDFDNVDIGDFVSFVSSVTGTPFIMDPHVTGPITVVSPRPIRVNEVFRFFQSVLEVNGYTTVETSGGVVKIVPSETAPTKSIETGLADVPTFPEDKLVTQVIHLYHLSPDDAKNLLTPLASKSGVIVSHPQSGTLIITDFGSNVVRLQNIIKALDVPRAGENNGVIIE
jgi:general secretion pathway protein D